MDNHPDQNVPLTLPPQNGNAAPDTAPPLFAGTVSLWLGRKTYVAAAFFIAVSAAAAIWGALNQPSSLGMPVMVIGVALFLATDVMLAYTIYRIRCLRYKITRRLIEREQGLLTRRVDSLDLGRVKDVQLKQTLVERMLNIGTIEIYSSDKTDPDMLIEAIPNARPVYEKLRDAVIELGQKRGVMPLG